MLLLRLFVGLAEMLCHVLFRVLEGEDPEKTAMPRVVVTLNHWKVLRNLIVVRRAAVQSYFVGLLMKLKCSSIFPIP